MNSRRMPQSLLARSVPTRRRPLAAACAAALLGLMLAGAAAAQEAPPQTPMPTDSKTAPVKKNAKTADKNKKKSEDSASNLDAIIVTGIAGSIENSMKAKQNSDSIIEAISAEDIGKLPDASIAESLSRVPGLATQRLNGRANMISIRGLDPGFAGTTLNGREQATIGENRGVEYDQYPSELISGVAIYKTPDASLIGQGLSGTVDLHTIKPLDLPGPAFAVNLRGEHTSNGKLNPGSGVGDMGHRASISYINQFFDHTLGVAVGFAHLDSPIQEKQYQAWWWSVNNGPAGIDQNWGGQHTQGLPDDVISQEGMQLRAQSLTQRRSGLMAVLEWAPGDHYHSTLDLYHSAFGEKKFTNGAQWSSSPYDNYDTANPSDPSKIPSYSNVGITPALPYPIVTSGTINGIKPILQNQYTKEHDKLFSAGWNNQYDFDNGWMATADLSYSSAKKKLHDAYLFTGLAGGAFTSVDFRTPAGNGYPDFSPAVNLADPSQVVFTDPDGYG